MSDKEAANDLELSRPIKSFEELVQGKIKRKNLTREEAINDVLKTVSKTNKEVDALFGLGGDYLFDYNIYPDNSNKKFLNACVTIEKKYPDNKKSSLLVDVDGTTIQIYYINNKKVTVYDDFEVGAVYVLSELDLKDIFKN